MVRIMENRDSYLGKYYAFLRRPNEMTLDDLSLLLSLNSMSSYKAYAEEKALPDIHKLMKLAQFFDVGISELVYQDIEHLPPQVSVRQYQIPKVPIAAAAGYARSFGDDNFLRSLDTIAIPFEPYGIARA